MVHLVSLYILSSREVTRYFVSKDNEMSIPWTILFCVYKFCFYALSCFISGKFFGLLKGQAFIIYKLAGYNQFTTVINYTHEKITALTVLIIAFMVLLPGKYLVMKQATPGQGWYLFPGVIYALTIVLLISFAIIEQAYYDTSSI
jgi:hypothetical protein